MADTIVSTDVPGVHGLVALNPDGSTLGTPVGGATSTNQTNGSQKSQIVDAGGEAVTVTGGKLDVNATASLAGESIPSTGATTAVAVQIVDGSGNQVASFGGGTQYTESDTDATIVGSAIMFESNTGTNTLSAVSNTTPLPISDAGGVLTVDGTVAVTNAGITTIAGAVSGTEMQVDVLTMPTTAVTNAGITTIAGAVSGTEMQVDVLTMPTVTVNSHAVTNAGTFAVQVDGSALTSLQLADDVVATLGTTTYTEAATKGTTIGAVRRDADTSLVDTTNEIGPLQMDANGRLKVEAFSGEALPVTFTGSGDVATQTTLAAINTKLVTGTDIGDVTINNSTGAAAVNIQDGGNTITVDGTVAVSGTVAVTQSGTWDEVGINDSGNSITVDYATTGSGTATGALRVELPTNGTGVIATVGAVTAITNALPAGTNAIGKLAANSGVDIGDVDVTSVSGTVTTKGIPSDIDINGSNANHAQKYYTNAGAVTDGIIWSPAAGKRWHILTLYINVSAAATVTLEDDLAGGDSAVWKGELAANSGVILKYDKEHPFSSTEDAADLIITTTAGNVYVQAVGYEV